MAHKRNKGLQEKRLVEDRLILEKLAITALLGYLSDCVMIRRFGNGDAALNETGKFTERSAQFRCIQNPMVCLVMCKGKGMNSLFSDSIKIREH